MKKKYLISIGLVLLFTGCQSYDNLGKPIYKTVKAAVKASDISDKTKERLKKIDKKAVNYDNVRNAVKDEIKKDAK